jgi:hypothetical protein
MQRHPTLLVILLLLTGPAAWAETDPASLALLHDIQVPPPVPPWWPLAPAWYLLTGLVLGIASWGLWRRRKRRQARRYRREALAALRALRRAEAKPRETVVGMLILLKRTALGAYPRPRVAALHGAAWWAFLDHTAGKPLFAEGLGALSEGWVYAEQGGAISARDLKRLYKASRYWIRHHRPAASLAAQSPRVGVGPEATEPQSGG